MTKKQFSERIKQLRIEKGFSQSDLAEKTGLTVRSIQRLEKGENHPRGDTLNRLSKVFDISHEELLIRKQTESLLYLIILSLSPLAFLYNIWLGVLIPFILWILRRKSIKNVDSYGRQVMNFQISWTLVFYAITIAIISVVVGKISLSGQISLFELNEILFLQVFKTVMYVCNISLILLSTYFLIRSGSSKVLFGFAFRRQKVNPVFLVIYIILLVVILTNQYFPKKDLKEKPKEEIVEFAKEAIFIPFMEDSGHSKKLKQFLHPAMDSLQIHRAVHQSFIPWGSIDEGKNARTRVADYGVSKSGDDYSYFLQIYYTEYSTRRIQRYLFEIQELNGHFYIIDYFTETLADSFFKKVELKKTKGKLYWKVSTPMGTGMWKDNKFTNLKSLNYRQLRKIKEGENHLFYMEDGKLKKERMKNLSE